MNTRSSALAAGIALAALSYLRQTAPAGADDSHVIFSDYRQQKPGVVHHIQASDLPAPTLLDKVDNGPTAVPRPADAWPKAPPGFKVELYASHLEDPHELKTAPNGDVFLAESNTGEIKVFRGLSSKHEPSQTVVFTNDAGHAFGMAFWPPGRHPQYLYVSNDHSVYRYRYKNGCLAPEGKRETVAELFRVDPQGDRRGEPHWTRDLAFSKNGRKLYVSVGSKSNDDDPDTHPDELERADVLEMNPDGSGRRVYASGVRNAAGIAVNPRSGEIWGSVTERDGLGDNVPPDYVTHFEDGGFYGWPYYYTGGRSDPRHLGQHPELRAKSLTPDVLIQAHNGSLGMAFYTGRRFPREYRGDLFAAEHGSSNRSMRTGYEVIRVPLKGKKPRSPRGQYQDFLTGFVTDDGQVWGRPAGVTVARDGALLVSDDVSKSIWRVSWVGR